MGGLIREHALSSDFPSIFTNNSLEAFAHIRWWVPGPLTDPDIFREPMWPAPEVSPPWSKGSQDNPRFEGFPAFLEPGMAICDHIIAD